MKAVLCLAMTEAVLLAVGGLEKVFGKLLSDEM
jgi:hypothetical protein